MCTSSSLSIVSQDLFFLIALLLTSIRALKYPIKIIWLLNILLLFLMFHCRKVSFLFCCLLCWRINLYNWPYFFFPIWQCWEWIFDPKTPISFCICCFNDLNNHFDFFELWIQLLYVWLIHLYEIVCSWSAPQSFITIVATH